MRRERFFHGRLFYFVISALAMGAGFAGAQSWVQWNPAEGGNGHYYALTSTATNWQAAEKLAVSWGGTLATITSVEEQNFINTTVLTGRFEHLPVWIGLFKESRGPFSGALGPVQVQVQVRRQPKDFQWVTGETFSWTNWKPGEPSDSPPGEDYVVMNWEYSDAPARGLKGDWNDTPLDGTTGYGGKTSGPYFGLVERETDPARPVKAGFKWYAVFFLLMGVVAAFFMIKGAAEARKRALRGERRESTVRETRE